jgi:hypothetical protein
LFVDHQKDHIAPEAVVVDFAKGQQRLAEYTATLFGPAPSGRGVRIMVTMPSEAADDALSRVKFGQTPEDRQILSKRP